jgi:signal transduction histidine kinase
VEPLLRAVHALGVDRILAVAAGAAAGVALALLGRARRRARRIALTEALQAAEARLLDERAAHRRFLTRALDEVKRPLGLLATSLDLALRRRPEVPELTAALRDAQHEADRIARLSARLVQLQTVAGAVQRAPLDLAAVVRSAWQLAQAPASQRGVTLALDAPGPAPVAGDAALLAQALDELLANALRASRFGGTVTLAVERRGEVVRATVRDEGPGIPPERRLACFEPLGRGPNGWSPAGLGLALAREIARGHGGTLTLGEAERGAALVLELPSE